MDLRRLVAVLAAGACAATLTAGCQDVRAQQSALPLGTSSGLNGLLATSLVFAAAEVNNHGAVSRGQLKTAVGRWFTDADISTTANPSTR